MRFLQKGLVGAVVAVFGASIVAISSSPVALAVPADIVSTAQMVGYWNFDSSGSIATPAVGGQVLTVNTGATYTSAGKFGGGLSLNGSSGALTASGTPTWIPGGNSPYSVSVWFNTSAYNMGGLVGWGGYGAGNDTNALRLNEGNPTLYNYWWGNDLACTVSCNWAINEWHHVATTYDGTSRKMYLDGILRASDTPGTNAATKSNFAIGLTAPSLGEYFQGTLDDVAIYSGALTASQVADLASATMNQATLSIVQTTGTAGTALNLSTSGGSGTGAVSFAIESTGTAHCTIANTSVTATSAGTCMVYAVKGASGFYNQATSVMATLTFAAAPTTTSVTTTTSTTTSTLPTQLATTTTVAKSSTTSTSPKSSISVTSSSAPPTGTTTTVPQIVSPNVVDPSKPITGPNGEVIELAKGESLALIGGQAVEVKSEVVSRDVSLDLGPVEVNIGAKGAFGLPAWPGADGSLDVVAGRKILLAGTGLMPGTRLTIYMNSTPKKIGEVEVDDDGEFSGSVTVPSDEDDGDHTVQVNGQLPNGSTVSSNMGVAVHDENSEEHKIDDEVKGAYDKCDGEDDVHECRNEVSKAMADEAERFEKSGTPEQKERAKKLRSKIQKMHDEEDNEQETKHRSRVLESELSSTSTRDKVSVCVATTSETKPYKNVTYSRGSILKAFNIADSQKSQSGGSGSSSTTSVPKSSTSTSTTKTTTSTSSPRNTTTTTTPRATTSTTSPRTTTSTTVARSGGGVSKSSLSSDSGKNNESEDDKEEDDDNEEDDYSKNGTIGVRPAASWGDIIPPFKDFPGLNWPAGKSVYADLCGTYVAPAAVTTTSSTIRSTTTTSSTAVTTSTVRITTTTLAPTSSLATSTTTRVTTITVTVAPTTTARPATTTTTITTTTTTTTTSTTSSTTSTSSTTLASTSTARSASTSTSTTVTMTTAPLATSSTSVAASASTALPETSTTSTVVPATTTSITVPAVTTVDEVLDLVDQYIENSSVARQQTVEGIASDLAPQVTVDTSTTSTAPIPTIPRTVRARVTIQSLKTDYAIFQKYVKNLDRAQMTPVIADAVQVVEKQTAQLHRANMKMLGDAGSSLPLCLYAVIFLLMLGLGFVIAWRRRWVWIEEDQCTACGECYSESPVWFGAHSDGRAFLRSDNDQELRVPRRRLPLPRAQRKEMLAIAKACEPAAIRVTIRRNRQ